MRGTLFLVAVLVLGGGVARAQKPVCDPSIASDCTLPKQVPKVAKPPKAPPTINIGGISLVGKVRSAMLLQFLERADEELERSSLESKSFLPALVRTIDDETL